MKKNLLAVFCSFMICAGGIGYAQSDKSLVRIGNITKADLTQMSNKGVDVTKVGSNYAEAVINKKDITEYKKSGHSIKYIIKDLDAYVANVQKAQTKGAEYYTYKTMSSQLKAWAKQYPNICRVESIGKSWENRDLWAIKISDNPNKNEAEPAALIMGDHHAREWPSVEVPMAAAKKLLEGYGKDKEMTRLVNTREIWIVPMVNPDGMTYSQTKSRMWRKNRRNLGDAYGVDPNRNYSYKWGNVGASSYHGSDTYHGEKPFSEPETRAIRDLATREHFQGSISFHTYSQLILYPYSYTSSVHAPDEKVLKQLATDMSKFNHYKPELSAGLYPAMGDSDDFLYGTFKTLSFTFELCNTFIPRYSQIPDVIAKNVPAVMYLIDKCGTLALTTPTGTKDLIDNLDLRDSLSALSDSQRVFGREGDIRMRNEVLNKVEMISKHAAKLVAADLKKGNTSSWKKLKATPGNDLAVSYVKNRVKFDAAQGTKYRSDILAEM